MSGSATVSMGAVIGTPRAAGPQRRDLDSAEVQADDDRRARAAGWKRLVGDGRVVGHDARQLLG